MRYMHRDHLGSVVAVTDEVAAVAVRYGYERQARAIQDAFLDGRRAEAVAAVPDDLVDEVCLVGPIERIVDRVGAWQASHVDTLILGTDQPEVLRALREAVG